MVFLFKKTTRLLFILISENKIFGPKDTLEGKKEEREKERKEGRREENSSLHHKYI